MALNVKAFQAVGATKNQTVGGAAGAVTVTIGPSTTGLPLDSVRITNAGTAAVFVQFISTTNTTTVAVTNAQPVLASQSVILSTGGQPAIGLNASGTFTVTAYITAGISGG